jgi:hypothetical protein
MRILIDGKPLDPHELRGDNLEEILGEIQELREKETVVSDVLVNGRPYSEDVPHAALEVSRKEIETLELTTCSVEEIALHFLKHSVAIIDALLAGLPKIVEMFRLGDESEANEHYLRLLESLQLLFEMVGRVGQALSLDFDRPLGSGTSLKRAVEKIATIMSDLLRIQEDSDWIYLADVLEYELKEVLSEFRDLLPLVRNVLH